MKKTKPIVKLLCGVSALSVCLMLFSCTFCKEGESCYHPLSLEDYISASKALEEEFGTTPPETRKPTPTMPPSFTIETSRRHHPVLDAGLEK